MNFPVEKRIFVHLAYLDDSDTKAKKLKWQVMAGVIVEDKRFKVVEIAMCAIQELLVPSDRLDKFEEFHASELYGGYGVFEGIEQEKRFQAIKSLLELVKRAELPIVYGAVDLSELQNAVYSSADPLDISFKICANGITEWAQEKMFNSVEGAVSKPLTDNQYAQLLRNWLETLVVVIADECEPKIRNTLQKSFRSLRPPKKPPTHLNPPIVPFHDDMYFGDSRFSVGIQLADLCSYFIARHLEGDKEIDGFYEMIAPQIVFSKHYPEQPLTPEEKAALSAFYTGKAITDGK